MTREVAILKYIAISGRKDKVEGGKVLYTAKFAEKKK